MTALLVGGDRLGNIPTELAKQGVSQVIHWTGRKGRTRIKNLPENIDMVLVLCDFVEHGLMNSVKGQAKAKEIPIIYSQRAITRIKEDLKEFLIACER